MQEGNEVQTKEAVSVEPRSNCFGCGAEFGVASKPYALSDQYCEVCGYLYSQDEALHREFGAMVYAWKIKRKIADKDFHLFIAMLERNEYPQTYEEIETLERFSHFD